VHRLEGMVLLSRPCNTITSGALPAAAHRYKSASTVRPETSGISRSLRSITAKGPRDLNCATSGLRDSKYRWSLAGLAAFIGVTSVAGNRRAQPTKGAMRAISRRAGMQKPDWASPAAVPRRLLQNDSG
jgi:hypothetical protein